MGKVAVLQTRGMAAAWSRKPINLYVCLSTYLRPPISYIPNLHLHLPTIPSTHPTPFNFCHRMLPQWKIYLSSLRRLFRHLPLLLSPSYYPRPSRIFFRFHRFNRLKVVRLMKEARTNKSIIELTNKYKLDIKRKSSPHIIYIKENNVSRNIFLLCHR